MFSYIRVMTMMTTLCDYNYINCKTSQIIRYVLISGILKCKKNKIYKKGLCWTQCLELEYQEVVES